MRFFSVIICTVLTSVAYAHDYDIRNLHIDHPWMYVTAPGVTDAYIYMRIENKQVDTEHLFAAETDIAERIEIRTLLKEENLFGSKEMQAIDILPQSTLDIGPKTVSSYYIKLIGIKRPIFQKFQFQLKLQFERAGLVPVAVYVEKLDYVGFLENNLSQYHSLNLYGW